MAKISTARSQPKKKKTSTPARPTAKAAAKKPAPKKVATKKPVAKKTAVKQPTAKKPVAKKPALKSAAKKTVTKKTPVKKTIAKKLVAKKTPPKKVVAKTTNLKKAQPKKVATKKAVKKVVATAPAKKATRVAPRRAPPPKAPAKTAPKAPPAPKGRAFRKEELASFRAMLQKNLELIQGNINALAGDNLKRSPLDSTNGISSHSTHMADHGTDNFDRELALSLASSRQDSVYAIEDAIRRIDEGDYGTCQACEKPIERPRLKALPFAKTCVACQNAAERGRSRFQPFKTNYNAQGMASDESPDMSDS